MNRLILLLVVLFALPLHAQTSDSIFNNLKPLIFRVKISETPNSPKNSYGTGFVVDKRGIIATNFHVVSDFTNTDEENNNIFVELSNGQYVPAELIGFSIKNDLALLRVEHSFDNEIKFSPEKLKKGGSLFSIGLPEDLQMSIVEGVYNGVEKSGPYEVFFLSSPINGGMSGGPTVNHSGQLVGINVARLVFSEDISFAVPKAKLEELVEKNKNDLLTKNLSSEEAEKEAYQQLGDLSKELFKDLQSTEQMDVEIKNWGTMSVAKDLKCWSDVGNSKELNYESATYNCRLNSSSYLSSIIDSGSYFLEFKTVVSKGARRWALFDFLGDADLRTKFSRILDAFDSSENMKKYYTSYNCESGFFEESPQEKFRRWSLCLRAYKKNEKVIDVVYQVKKEQNGRFYLFKIDYEGLNASDLEPFVKYWADKSIKM